MGIKFDGPLLIVNDIKASQNFCEMVLQQKVVINHGECIGFESLSILGKDIANSLFQYPKEKLLKDRLLRLYILK
jgi:hypothetical protein